MSSMLNSPLLSGPVPAAVPGKPRRLLRRVTWPLAAASALFILIYVFRSPLLTNLAQAWVVNEPTTKADAIVVLGGGLENRPFAAAKLFQNGVAPRILYMNVKPGPVEEIGVTLPEAELTRRLLLSNGVPETAMTAIGSGVTSTYDESKAVHAWMAQNPARILIIPTDAFHTRRVRWIFRKELRDTNAEIHVVAVNPRRYKLDDWWSHEEGVIAFESEIIKFLYYRFKY